jgi:phenylacetate-coenzyme A ligase PaaK-like adenylate-forming protein
MNARWPDYPSPRCESKQVRRLFIGGRLAAAEKRRQTWLKTGAEEMAAFQLPRLREAWREAVQHVPYYGNLVRRGLACADFESFEEFRGGVPVLTRAILASEGEAFRRAEPPARILMTAGSTGTPLRFGCFKAEDIEATAINQWAGRLSNGMRPDDRVLTLWGHSHLLGTGFKGVLRGRLRQAKDALLGYRRINAYSVGPEEAVAYYQAAKRFRPRVVIGYACALDLWARQCLGKGLSLRGDGIALCVACSEVFPQADSRRVLEEFLGCQTVMEYGGVDFGVCAYELLGQDGYRTFWWSHFLETEGGAADGALLITSLTKRYLPLFRYRNGDECSGAQIAASGHVVGFGQIQGRVNDTLTMPDGKVIHSVGIFHCIHQEPVWAIQLVQSPGGLRIRLAADGISPAALVRIRARLRDLHPGLESVPIEIANDLVTNRAGKRRWIVQEGPLASPDVPVGARGQN